ncbi:MAG: VOC family protein [Acidimicrobiia bacterium]|nr:VOC family protein [Acidimicrobiia bacterium]
MQPLDIHHVSINVSDVAEALAFYTGVLGGVERDDRPDFGFGGAWIDFGGRQLHLIEAPVPAELGQHFAVRVADIRATIEELRARGLEVSDAVPVASNLQAFLKDPAGNGIELHEVGAPA